MNTATCIGVGIFFLTVQVHSQFSDNSIGNLVPIAFLVSSLPAMLVSTISAKWSKQWPSIGGDYTYYKQVFPKPISFLISWGFWFAIPFQIQGAALSALMLISQGFKNIGYYTQSNFIHNNIVALAILIILFGFIVNFLRIEGIITLITLALTCILVVLFIYYTIPHNASDYMSFINNNSMNNLEQLPSADIIGFILGCSVLTFSYGGITFGQHGGEECKDDFSKGITKAIVVSLSICIIIYFLISFSLYKAVPWRYIVMQAIENKDSTALNVVMPYIPKTVLTSMYFLLSIAVVDNIFTLGFRAIRMAVAFSRDNIFSSKLAKPIFNGPGYMAMMIYFITILVTVVIHYDRLAILANYSYSLGLIATSLMVFRIKNGEEIFGSSKNLKVFKYISVFCISFYLINLVGIMIFLPDMTIWWFSFIALGVVVYYSYHLKMKNRHFNMDYNSMKVENIKNNFEEFR